MAKNRLNIAVIPGDGIGKEVIPEGIRVLQAAMERFDINLNFDHFDFASYNYYAKHGQMMPDDWNCLLYTSPSPRDRTRSRMPSSA